jgi:2-amino-4-hydroxy-6-hydroxymethyldihydropteridine diphosphokinase
MPIVFLGLGSNLGNRIENLRSAIIGLEPEARAIRCSPVYETPPWGYEDQPRFLNQVVKVETELAPGDLMEQIKEVENNIGREETFRYGPRSIDIDILFYDDLVIDSPPLIIPHARIPERAFVLIPMADLDPGYLHPKLDETIENLLEKVNREGIKYYSSAGCPGEDEQIW